MPNPVPEWLAPFAESVAGIRLSARGNVEIVPRSEFHVMARQLMSQEAKEFYQQLARWFLADPSHRPVNPF
jgi:hypothetical protein